MKNSNSESIDCASVSSSNINNINNLKQLLKRTIDRKSFLSAYKYLLEIDKTMENSDIHYYDTSLLKASLETIVIGVKNHLSNSNIFLTSNMDKPFINDLYDSLIKAFNANDYEKCLEIIDTTTKLTNEETTNDLAMLKIVIEENKRVYQEFYESHINYLYEQLKEALNSNESLKTLETIQVILTKEDEPKELVYNALYNLIIIGYYKEAAVLLNAIKITDKNKDLIKILQRAINENMGYSNLSQYNQKIYLEAKSLGKMHYHDGEYRIAYNTFSNAFAQTGLDIFLYYLGKVMWSIKQYDKAEEYLLAYVNSGTSKLSKAYNMLAEIERKRQNKAKTAEYRKKANLYIPLYEKTMLFIGPNKNSATLQLKPGTDSK